MYPPIRKIFAKHWPGAWSLHHVWGAKNTSFPSVGTGGCGGQVAWNTKRRDSTFGRFVEFQFSKSGDRFEVQKTLHSQASELWWKMLICILCLAQFGHCYRFALVWNSKGAITIKLCPQKMGLVKEWLVDVSESKILRQSETLPLRLSFHRLVYILRTWFKCLMPLEAPLANFGTHCVIFLY